MKNIVSICALIAGCTIMHYNGRHRYNEQQAVVAKLEEMTAAGQFSIVAQYVHDTIDKKPERYMDEMYDGARVALRHNPRGVYVLAADQYEEDMTEDMQSLIFALQRMSEDGFVYKPYTK